MKKIYLIILLAAGTIVYSQTTLFFHSRFGLNEDDNGNAIIQTLDTNYFVVGQSNSFGESQTDIYISKLNRMGLPFWQRNLGGFLLDVGKSVVELNDSSFVIAGYTNSFGAGGYDAYIVKVDKNGNVIWQKTFGGGDWDFAYSINKTTDGNLIICGATYSFGRGNKDGLILKMDYNGNVLWNKIYGGAEEDDLREIIQTSDGGYIAVGTTKSYGDNLGDIWITKFDASGDSTWFKTNGGNKVEVGNAIVQDKNTDYLITGGSESYSFGKEDAYIFKLDNTGNFIWKQNYGLAGEDEESYDVLNSGSAYGSILITYGTKEQFGNGLDIKTLLLDFNGNYVRGGSFGGPKDDVGYSLYNTFDKGYIACGKTESYNALNVDVFIVKYDSEMTIGPLVTRINQINQQKYFNLYPTVISDSYFFIQNSDVNSNQLLKIKLVDVVGNIVEPIKVERYEINLFKIYLPETINGLYIINLNDGQFLKKCLIQ